MRDVFPTFAQGRHSQFDDIEPIVKILAETAAVDTLLELAVGRRNDAYVDRFLTGATDLAHPLFLDGPQQFDLHGQRQVSDLVEEQRSAVGGLKEAFTFAVGASERAFAIAEKFAFHQVFRDGPAVDRNEGRGLPGALLVDQAGCQFLAATGFSGDVDGGLAACQLADQFAYLDDG